MKDVVELGLRKASPQEMPARPSPPGVSALKGLAEAFLRVMADFSPNAEVQDVKTFASEIADFRLQIAQSDHDQETRRLAASALRACELFLKKSRRYYAECDDEIQSMIGIVRDLSRYMAGDNVEFTEAVRSSNQRFRGLAELDNIRELKKRLADEANALQRTVEEKQKRDAEALSALNERVETLQVNFAQAEAQASVDPLTRIPNRGSFDRLLADAIQRARTSRVPYCVAMLDVDHFKTINDTHGHLIGDRVILCVAQRIAAAVSDKDVVARYGGEEFAVILADHDLAAAETRVRKVAEDIAARTFEYQQDGETRTVRFTLSGGIAQFTASETDHDLVHRADQALYEAKRQGRNRVVAKKRSKLSSLFA